MVVQEQTQILMELQFMLDKVVVEVLDLVDV